jgi:hypothetical protein
MAGSGHGIESGYREKAEVAESPEVFCKDCVHLVMKRLPYKERKGFCRTGPEVMDPVEGRFRQAEYSVEKNARLDCGDFERKVIGD